LNATNQILTIVYQYYSLWITIILKSLLNEYIIDLFGLTYFLMQWQYFFIQWIDLFFDVMTISFYTMDWLILKLMQNNL
jgi:hypothetical protein